MNRRTFVTALPILVASASVARAAPTPAGAPRRLGGPLTVGEPPPPLSVSRIAGTEQTTLAGLAGRVVVLDFWATWCSPCRAIMPVLDTMYQRYQARGLSVLGLSPESERDIRAHISANPVRYTIARDVGDTIRAYGVRGIPMLVVLGRDGKVREVFVGVDGGAVRRLDGLVQRLLTEST